MIYGQPETFVTVCEHCREAVITRRVWAQAGASRKPIMADVVTVLIAADKCIGLWARGEQVGLMPGHSPAPTLASTAAKLGGRWIALRHGTWARPEAIAQYRADGDHGAHLIVDGLAVHSTRKYWPAVRRLL
jgi:hypothetical protein